MRSDGGKLAEFLTSHPSMRLTELTEHHAVVDGVYCVDTQLNGFKPIQEKYHLKIIIPAGFPKVLPTVFETQKRIPRISEYHTYNDGSFCLGSAIRLKAVLFEFPTVLEFVEKILVPFLYAVTYKLRYGLYPFGELDHGEVGLIDDYQRIFCVVGKASVMQVLVALSKRKRVANKLSCPCGCRTRIGTCGFRFKLIKWRQLERRRWFESHILGFAPRQIPQKLQS